MRVLIWHVHGSWMTSFVQGPHTYLIPVVSDRGPDGRGRAQSWTWPDNAVELTPDELADSDIDVAVIQRIDELELAAKWLGGRRLGRDVPLVWLEHNTPRGPVAEHRHPVADRDDAVVVHVTHTNALFWDTGAAPVRVIEHGVADPGQRWTGEQLRTGVLINEPVRRWRVTGTDLLPRFAAAAPIDLFGIAAGELSAKLGGPPWLSTFEDVSQADVHARLARHRCYLHPYRWTSLGLSLIEAMLLGVPVVALATTAVPDAVPSDCGVVSNDVGWLVDAIRRLCADPELASRLGAAGRRRALDRFGLDRFLAEWNDLLEVL